jgi:ribonuclease PH
MNLRADGRRPDQLRPLRFTTDVNLYAEGSCLVELGHTRVHCTATIEDKLPDWRRASGKGWITAEYRMLPRATDTRTQREGRNDKKGRTSEIERLVGRALRAAVDLEVLGPRNITIDCDVLQADGGTRCAAINGGYVALASALQRLVEAGKLETLPLRHTVAAISVGIVGGTPLVDLRYAEDSTAEVDLNLVMTGSGLVVEVQGTAEGEPFSPATLQELVTMGTRAIATIDPLQREVLRGLDLLTD